MRNLVRLIVIVALLSPGFARAQGSEPFALAVAMGRGAVQRAEWQPNGSLILVDTVRGAWLYTPSLADAGFLPDARLARFSPDGSRLAGVDPDNRIVLWDAVDFHKTAMFSGHPTYVRALEWSPDGRHLASLDRTGAIRVWDVETGGDPLALALEGADTLAWSKAGSYLAALDEATGHLEVWTIDGTPVMSWGRLEHPSDYGYEMLWRDDAQLMWIANGEVPVGQLWDSVTHTITRLDVGYAYAFSPDGSKLAAAFVGSGQVSDVDTGELLVPVVVGQSTVVSWSPDGSVIAFGTWTVELGATTLVMLVDGTTGEILNRFRYDHTIRQLAWNPAGDRLIVVDDASQIEIVGLEDSYSRYHHIFAAHTAIGATAAWRSDGQLIATADTLDGATLWDVHTGQALDMVLDQGQPASQLVWQPGGTLLAAAGGNGEQSLNNNVTVWESQPEPPTDYPRVITLPHTQPVTGLAWSPDGTTLASAERSQYLRFWQPATPDRVRIIDLWANRLAFNIHIITPLHAIRWDRDSRQLLISYWHRDAGNYTQVIDVAGEPTLTFQGPTSYTSSFTWTPDNRFLWAKWGYGYIDIGMPPIIHEITLGGEDFPHSPGTTPLLSGLTEQVAGGALNPDGTLLLGWDVSGRGLLWDTATQAVQFSLDGVDDAAWAPDGSLLVVYGADGVIRLLDPATDEVVQALAQHFHDTRDRISGNPQVIWGADSQRFAVLDRGALFVYTRGM